MKSRSVKYVAFGALIVGAAMPAEQVNSIMDAPPAALAALLSASSTSAIVASNVVVPNTILDQVHEIMPPGQFQLVERST